MGSYTTKLGDKICEHTATSSIGLRHICKQLGVPYSTATDWIYDKKHELYEKYARAKMLQLYHIEDEIIEIADDSTNDYMTIVRNGKKVIVQNREAIARSRLRINTRITLLTKLAPRYRRFDHEEVTIVIKGTPLPGEAKAEETQAAPQPSGQPSAKPPADIPIAKKEAEKTPSSSPKNAPKPAPAKLSENERLRAIHEEQLRSYVDSSATSRYARWDNPMRGYAARVLRKK